MNSNRITKEEAEKLDRIAVKMHSAVDTFISENTTFTTKSNQQASKRARVASIKLTNLAKKYRRESMIIVSKLPTKD